MFIIRYRETLRRFVEEGMTNSSLCEASDGGDEDVNMGKLAEVRVSQFVDRLVCRGLYAETQCYSRRLQR